MTSIEIVAASVDEALAQAASELGVPADSLQYEVIDETKGLFGRPGKVTVRVQQPDSASPVSDTPAVEEAAAPVPEKKARTPRRRKSEDSAPAEPASADSEKSEAPPKADEPDVVATKEDGDFLIGILNELLSAGDLAAIAKVSELNGRYVHIDIAGDDVSYLVGRRGEVLNSIQYLMNVISARKLNNGVRVVVEGDDYREDRARKLTAMAQSIAEQVIERGEEAVLDALPAFERRVIHQALLEIEGVTTYSEGEEPNRCVVIAPAQAE